MNWLSHWPPLCHSFWDRDTERLSLDSVFLPVAKGRVTPQRKIKVLSPDGKEMDVGQTKTTDVCCRDTWCQLRMHSPVMGRRHSRDSSPLPPCWFPSYHLDCRFLQRRHPLVFNAWLRYPRPGNNGIFSL